MSGLYKGMSFALAGVCALFLTACGQQAGGDARGLAEENVTGEDAGEELVWTAAGFAAPDKPEKEQTLWAVQFRPWEHRSRIAGDGEMVCLDRGVCGELFWYLGAETVTESRPEAEYVLDIYDTVSGENTVKRFTPLELGLDSTTVLLSGMDMLDREHYVLR